MKLFRLFASVCTLVSGLILVTALVSAPAYAFQETHITPSAAALGDAPEKAQKALSGATKNIDAMELTTPDLDADLSGGTEINIPGIGRIGKLPKLDFGLELLYGADEKPAADAIATDEENPDSEVMIRGTVKHRF